MDAEAQLLEVCNELLKKIREVPENKKCFDCSDVDIISPRYVCTDFQCLVCSCCANIHMEFGHHIKCLNLFAFTLNEILSLRDSGNKLAAYKWLAFWSPEDFPEPDPTSLDYKEAARKYMKAKYVEKRWARESPKGSPSMKTEVDHLHDDKADSPHLSHRASNFAANNPFVSSSSPSSPYISTPSRMSFPPQSGQSPAVTIDLQQYTKLPLSVPPSTQTSPSRKLEAKYNPFEDPEGSPINHRELLRSRTLLDLNNISKEEPREEDTFKPVVRIRSSSASALLHSGSEGHIALSKEAGNTVILPSGQELKFPSKALPPRPDQKASAAPQTNPPVASPTPLSPIVTPVKDTITTPKDKDKDEHQTPEKQQSTPTTILKSPLRINTIVKALSLAKLNSPTALDNADSLGEEQPETPEKQISGKMQGIMSKMSSLAKLSPVGAAAASAATTDTTSTPPTTVASPEGEEQSDAEKDGNKQSTKMQGIMNKMTSLLAPKKVSVTQK